MLAVAVALFCSVLAFDEPARGYPLFFGSFEDVGERRVEPEILPLAEADADLENWLRGCKADAFLVLKDSSPFDISELHPLKRLAERSLTLGSFITDTPLDSYDLAKDLEDYCDAEFLVANFEEERPVAHWADVRPRVIYAELDLPSHISKEDALKGVLQAIPSPYVTVIYTSLIPQQRPVFRSVKLDQRRLKWRKRDPENVVPIIAPLIDHKDKGYAAPDPTIHLPDNFFLTLFFGSLIGTIFLLYRDIRG